jgi:hypothetical protein
VLLGEDYEAFAKPLRLKTNGVIRKLALSEGVDLAVIPDREQLIQDFWCLLKGQPLKPLGATPPAAVDVTPVDASLPSPEPLAAGEVAFVEPLRRTVRARRDGYYRCGRKWSGKAVTLQVDELEPAQWERLCADSNLIVRDVKSK